MIYYAHVPRCTEDIMDLYEFDGEHANCCSNCKYNGNCVTQMNDLVVYYNPPLDCDSKDDCKRYYERFIKNLKPIEGYWDLGNKA